MADQDITDLAEMTDPAANDLLHVIDVSAAAHPQDRKMTLTTLMNDADLAASEAQRGPVELATTAEAQAGTDTSRAVTPQSLAMFSGRVKSVEAYGAVGDGVTDDTAEINWAWEAMTANGALIFEAGKTYAISSTLLFNDNTHYCVIQGNGATITVLSGANMTGLPMLNLAGSAYTKVYNLNFSAPVNTTPPIAGLVLGRTGVFHGSRQAFYSCCITGYFTFSAYYNVGSECSTFIVCTFENYRDGGYAAFISNEDSQSLLGVNAGQLTGWYYGCVFHAFGAGSHSIVLRGYVSDHAFIGCYGVVGLGGHFVHCEASTAGIKAIVNCDFDSIRVEPVAGDNSDARFFYNNADEAVQACTIRNIGWNMNTGTASTDPDYIYELHGAISGLELHLLPNTYNKKALLINSDCTLTNCKVWGDKSTDGVAQVTVESGATIYRSKFYWPDNYPFDATPAGMNLIGFVDNDTPGDVITIADGDTTPSLGGGRYFTFGNTNPTTVTDFDDMAAGQEVMIYSGDFVTTLDLSGTNLKGNDGVDYLLVYPDMIRVKFMPGGTWKLVEIIKA